MDEQERGEQAVVGRIKWPIRMWPLQRVRRVGRQYHQRQTTLKTQDVSAAYYKTSYLIFLTR